MKIGLKMEHNISEKKRKEVNGDSQRQDSGKWTELLTQLVDKMTGKDVSIKYEFDNLEIDVPKATGPGGQELGSAKWLINGSIIISSKVGERNVILWLHMTNYHKIVTFQTG